ncbi:Eco57I restriction-modification methylase domain-containing protein [Acidovorax sp. SRB_24]|uniref:DUF7149 domain-containing protein n=1 Tax=Acidovorax sp. SRB_24 TaxID=1962700 RepID=UPI00145D24EE|nr:TaqI-like C-terminal specificity domain-containing protein [Acidovorax sp. SRB_24]NMM76222.1 hypothetical protein [Acidovorax sp. SRB_24]
MTEISVKQALNKAFLKTKPPRSYVEVFKNQLIRLLDNVNVHESEEHHKNLISDFLRKIGYDGKHSINTKARTDLVIHNGRQSTSAAGVIIETKKPTNKSEMPQRCQLNTKALQELLLYYLRERVVLKNLEIRNLAITNACEWFIFDAQVFERLFAQDKELTRKFNDFEQGRLSGTTTEFFYKQIASPAIQKVAFEIVFTYVDLRDYEAYARDSDAGNDRKLIELLKVFSPEHLLKLPFQNDSNSLDKGFYSELLHLIGLEEVKDKGRKIIRRKLPGKRNAGALIENAITQVDALDKLNRINNLESYGSDKEEQLLNVGLELCITWINRIIFLKLLEAQLVAFNGGNKDHAFLHSQRVRSYDDLNALFFRVLARHWDKRDDEAKLQFGQIPYLNSSLFEPTALEHETLLISNLSESRDIQILSTTVLKSESGKRRVGKLDALTYLLLFLDAYDFASTGAEAIQEDEKSLISASVLGLIFEKINNYQHGAFFTPGFVTMYMAHGAVRTAVLNRFNKLKGWTCANFRELYDKIEDRQEANNIINELRICDPAVGSGHFLVSVLNELIAVKSELRILTDVTGARLKEYRIEVSNDELVILDEDGDLFEYKRHSAESQRVQEAIFHEKARLIENCLFGVDINPNSAKICRLRLWIELLKSAYYKSDDELETLPNIDINIKAGNSLIARYPLNADLRNALKKSKRSTADYQAAVVKYRTATSKDEKFEMERLISEIKSSYQQEIHSNDSKVVRHRNASEELETLARQKTLFGLTLAAKKRREHTVSRLTTEVERLGAEIEAIRNSRMFRNAFEWRFEFPEALNSQGAFHGFDLIIGNPPYGVSIQGEERKHLVARLGKVPDFEIYYWFINRAQQLLANGGILSFIVPNTILFNLGAAAYRLELFNYWALDEILDCTNFSIFAEATVRNVILTGRRQAGTTLTYRPTADATSFPELVLCERESISQEQAASNNLNWGLLFRLPKETIDLIIKIRSDMSPLRTYFPEISQGLIAYDRYQGQDEHTIKNRVFHSTIKHSPEWKQWLWGSDVTRFHVSWNRQEFIKYGAGIANPRNPKFFVGRRLLVREISNPRIFAAITSAEFYNDPAILIVKDNSTSPISLECVAAILNSKLATFFHFNSSPKASKGAFPKILIHDIETFPLPHSINANTSLELVSVARRLEANAASQLVDKATEERLDALVYKLYGLSQQEVELVEKWFAKSEESAVRLLAA